MFSLSSATSVHDCEMATWARTKSAVPTVATLVLAAIVIWGVNNIDVLQNQVNEDLGAPAASVAGPAGV